MEDLTHKLRTFFFSKKKDKKEKTKTKEWKDAIIFALIAAVIIRWAIFTPYKIPTPSMEYTMLVGDYLVVSKLSYGPKTPETPLQIPLMSNSLFGSSIPSYVTWLNLPVFRFPGFQDVERNDVVVFHNPVEWKVPSDMRTPYIKRCIGISGDTLQVIGQKVHINGAPIAFPTHYETTYFVKTKTRIPESVLIDLDINIDHTSNDLRQMKSGYQINTTEKTAEKLRKIPGVEKVEKVKLTTVTRSVYPHVDGVSTAVDNFGPIYIPKKGDTIEMTARNLAMYQEVIKHYERNDDIKYSNSAIYLNGKKIEKYTFKQNYYFMMGDNRHNSEDSRFFGFVPEDHVIGKAIFTWWSVNKNVSWFNIGKKIRWDRIFRAIDK